MGRGHRGHFRVGRGGTEVERGQAEVDTGGGRGPGGSRWFLGITNGHTRMVVRTHTCMNNAH